MPLIIVHAMIQLIKLFVQRLVSDHGKVQLSDEDESSWYGSDDEVNVASDMDKEWQRRRDQFHTVVLLFRLFFSLFIFISSGSRLLIHP